MNTKSIIEIFRGDDSDALGYQTIVGTIHTDLDLTGCKAVFRYLGFFQEFDPIPEDGKLTIVIPSASSMQFPSGFGYASLKVYDIDRKVRTFTNRIPVFVKTMTPCRGGGEFDVEFSPFPELAPLRIFKGPNADDFDQYTGFISKIIDRASAQKYGLSMLFDAMNAEKTAEGGCAASPAAVKAAYDAVIGVLTDNYYTKTQTDEAIDKLAAYYITSNAQGNPFATHAALVNATTYYSGGSVRTPTRNDYAIVVADETHNNEEWRYIYSENEQGVGQWEPQYAVEGVITLDDNVTRTSANPVKSSGIWSALWGALSALPTGFSSLYDWCVAQIAKLRDKLDLNVYGYGDPVVSFADGFSIVDSQGGGSGQRYTAPSGGETITFIGPVPSSNPYLSNYKFYYPSTLGTLDSFDPDNYSVWCLVCPNGGTTPSYMMYRTGPYYYIGSFNSVTPTLTLGMGEATGDAPTMARPLVATGDTLAKVSQMNTALAGKMPSTATGADIAVSGTDSTKINAALAGKASTADATLTPMYSDTPTFSEWSFNPATDRYGHPYVAAENGVEYILAANGEVVAVTESYSNATMVSWVIDTITITTATRTRTDIIGYTLGSQSDKPLASEAEAEALRQGKQNALSAQQLANIAAVSDALAFDATHSYAAGDPVVYNGTLYTFTTAHTGAWTGSDVSAVDIIARLAGKANDANVVHKTGAETIEGVKTFSNGIVSNYDINNANGFITTMGVLLQDIASGYIGGDNNDDHLIHIRTTTDDVLRLPSGDVTIPRANGMVALTAGTGHEGNLAALDASGNPTDAGWTAGDLARYALTTKTIDNGAVTLDDRAINAVAVSSSLASLTVNFPSATSGKARDFGLRLTVASGVTTAPELVLPQGVTCENADGEAPEIGADGAATILYFTETASGVFLVKGEVVTAIS